tara:strand:+ start:646 stop:2145 length:1500 start_codon:yes stop_codon:yes gene_type:complete
MPGFHPSRRAYPTPINISTDITNMPLAGGNKLQGLPPSIDIPSNLNRPCCLNKAWNPPEERTKIVCINQLGGIGKLRSQFVPTADGINGCPDLFDSYNFTLFDNFANSKINNLLISQLVNADASGSGTGIGTNGFKSSTSSADPFSSNSYIAFELNGEIETQFNPIMESIDIEYFNMSSYNPRSINSNSIRFMVANHNVNNRKLHDITINSITISYISGTGSNGGDKPDMFTNLSNGQLTWPESLYLELVGPYGQVDLIEIFSTKDKVIPTPKKFDKVYDWFMKGSFVAQAASALCPVGSSVKIAGGKYADNNTARAIRVPVGTPYVTGQSFGSLLTWTLTNFQNASSNSSIFNFEPACWGGPTAVSAGANYNQIFVQAVIGIANPTIITSDPKLIAAKQQLQGRVSELGEANYYKPLITYPQNTNVSDPTLFATKTISINKTFKIDDLLPDINEITKFRIFQERHTGTADNYGIRYLDINISYRTWKPDIWNNAYRAS